MDRREQGEFKFSWLDDWFPAVIIAFGIACVIFLGTFDPQTSQAGAGSTAISATDHR